jgi:hypothetical protein
MSYILTETARKKVEDTLRNLFGENPSPYKIKQRFSNNPGGTRLDVATIEKLITGKYKKETAGVHVSTIERWFDLLELDPPKYIDYVEIPQNTSKKPSKNSNLPNQVNNVNPEPLPLGVYVERPLLEKKCYEAMQRPGGLIRLTAPKKMGKTMLLNKVLSMLRNHGGYKIVILRLSDFSEELANKETFFKSFCFSVSRELNLQDETHEYWNNKYPNLGVVLKASYYFEEYLLPNIQNNFVLAIEEIESLFPKLEIFDHFCQFIRSSHEKAAQPDKRIWEKLRLIIVNSTKNYPHHNKNYSPCEGVGTDINDRVGLTFFTEEQVKTLLRNNQLDIQFSDQDFNYLMKLVNGHPYLTQLAFDYLKETNTNDINIPQLLDFAHKEQGIFSFYLKRQLNILKINSDLMVAYKTVIMANEAVKISEIFRFQLHSLGLINLEDNDYCVVSCDLYRRYFSDFFQGVSND